MLIQTLDHVLALVLALARAMTATLATKVVEMTQVGRVMKAQWSCLLLLLLLQLVNFVFLDQARALAQMCVVYQVSWCLLHLHLQLMLKFRQQTLGGSNGLNRYPLHRRVDLRTTQMPQFDPP
jgi:hypothetical protein